MLLDSIVEDGFIEALRLSGEKNTTCQNSWLYVNSFVAIFVSTP